MSISGACVMRKLPFLLLVFAFSPFFGIGAPATDPQKEALAILERGIEAHGGAKKLSETSIVEKLKPMPQVYKNNSRYTITWKSPEMLRVHNETDGKPSGFLWVFNGEKGWTIDESGFGTEMDRAGAAPDFGAPVYVTWGAQLLIFKGSSYLLTPLDKAKIGQMEVVGIKVTRDGDPDQCLYFDGKSGRLVKRTWKFTSQTPGRGDLITSKVDFLYEDYKEEDGISYPALITKFSDDKKIQELVVTDFKSVERIDPDLFKFTVEKK
jgi:outer membrane lipoprotein-sorting protein